MYFKLVSKNGYRDLVRNARRISISDLSDSEKREAYQELYEVLKPRLGETTRTLNAEAAYADRITHWNQRDVAVLKPVKTDRNPWLRFKREFVNEFEKAVLEGDQHHQLQHLLSEIPPLLRRKELSNYRWLPSSTTKSCVCTEA